MLAESGVILSAFCQGDTKTGRQGACRQTKFSLTQAATFSVTRQRVDQSCRFSTVPPEGHLTMIPACLLTGRWFPFPLNPVPPPLPPGPTGSDFDIIPLFTGPLITSPISTFLPQGLCTGHSLCLNILSSLLGLANCLTLLLCSQPLPPLPNLTPPQLSSALSLLLLTGQPAS